MNDKYEVKPSICMRLFTWTRQEAVAVAVAVRRTLSSLAVEQLFVDDGEGGQSSYRLNPRHL